MTETPFLGDDASQVARHGKGADGYSGSFILGAGDSESAAVSPVPLAVTGSASVATMLRVPPASATLKRPA